MQVGDQSVDQADACAAYAKAAGILPGDTRPYEALFDVYREDGTFTADEEEQFEQVITPHLPELEAVGDAWYELAFETGKLYWYYYDNTDGVGPSGEEGYARMRAASRWMHEAAEGDFAESGIAAAYADIADFACDIVPHIEDGTDAGLYAPHFARLQELVEQMQGSDNAVMRLDTASLVLDALRAYPRKFRADGISQEDMESLVANAEALAEGAQSTSEEQDERQASVVSSAALARASVANAFVDVGRIDD